MINNFLLDVLAAGAILSGILVITSKNPVIAVLFLISTFVNTAGYLLLLGVGFIGISYIIVYVGAIAVLFLFVIMMINIKLADILDVGSQYTKNLPLALTVGSLFTYEIFTIIPFSYSNVSVLNLPVEFLNYLNGLFFSSGVATQGGVNLANNPYSVDTIFNSFLQIEALGQGFYTYGAMWLILSSVILLLAMLAPILIVHSKPTQTPGGEDANKSTHPFHKVFRTRAGTNLGMLNKASYHTSSSSKNTDQFIVQTSLKTSPSLGHSRRVTKPLTGEGQACGAKGSNLKLNPWLVTGLTDAEGCFAVIISKKAGRKFGLELKLRFIIHMHIRDLELLKSVRDFYGVGLAFGSDNSSRYEVSSKADLNIIITHFLTYPLQTSKKHMFYIFSKIFEMYCNKEHSHKEGLLKMFSYINFLNNPLRGETLSYIVNNIGSLPFLVLPPVPVLESVILPSPWWTVGFVIGDGSFSYKKIDRTLISTNEERSFFYMLMSISQLKFDKYILVSILNQLQVGTVYEYPARAAAELVVTGLSKIQHVILPFFLQYPLVGFKLVQYEVWSKAVLLSIGSPNYSKERELRLIELMAELSDLNGNVEQKKLITRSKSGSDSSFKVE